VTDEARRVRVSGHIADILQSRGTVKSRTFEQDVRQTGLHAIDLAARREGLRAAAILVGWWLFLGIVNCIWLKRDTRPPTWDPAVHLTSSVRYRHVLQNFLAGKASVTDSLETFVGVDAFYPPLVPLVGAVLSLGMPPEPDSSTWLMNQFFLGLLIFGTYRLGRRFAGRSVGIAAAIAVTSFGGVWQASHLFMLDLPMAAMTALSLEELFATDRFASARHSLLLGILCGLGMLTKWMFLFYLAVPFGAEALAAARLPDRLRRFRNISISLAVGLSLALSWYLFHAPNLIQEFIAFGFHWEGSQAVWSLWGLTFYLRSLPMLLLLPWLAVLTVTGIVVVRRDESLRRFALLSLSGLLFLTLLRSKNERYALPALPALAIVATAPIGKGTRRPRLVFGAVFGVAVASIAVALQQDPPVSESWPISEALDAALAPPLPQRPCVRVIPDLPFLERFAFEHAAEARRYSVDIEGGSGFPTFTDAVILKTGDQGSRSEPSEIMAAISRDDGGFHEIFRKTWEAPLPDGSRLEVYRRDVQPVAGISALELVEKLREAMRSEASSEIHAPFAGRVEVETYSDEETLRGRFRRLALKGEDQRLGGGADAKSGLRVRELGCELDNVTVNPRRLASDGELEVLALDALTPHLRLREEDVASWLRGRESVRGLQVIFQGGLVRARLLRDRSPGAEIALRPEIVDGQNLGFRVESFRLAGMPIPSVLLSALIFAYNPILKEMPCRIEIARLRCERGELAVNPLERIDGQELQSHAILQRSR
jgi:hypothetical protein